MKKGFSLVELSIVLAIIGLLVGAVIGGQAFIRAAELRSVTTERSRYLAAAIAFQQKYDAWPGDAPNATSYWGTAANCPGTTLQPSTNQATCDGDGDGLIQLSTYSNERYRFWQHLANAGLIEGKYTGVTGPESVNSDSVIGSNVPGSKLGNAGWTILYYGQTTNALYPNLFYGNHFTVGADASTTYTYTPALKPEEVWSIDSKIDDGMPLKGHTIVGYWAACSLADNNSDYEKAYRLDTKTTSCSIIFRELF